eukprot:INCI15248.1.p1 GENE.INCI15248.1~~INCI15248.1.p1  ORF type:complete len:2168 (-),score=185.95 INCI15248.1:165-6668(-)
MRRAASNPLLLALLVSLLQCFHSDGLQLHALSRAHLQLLDLRSADPDSATTTPTVTTSADSVCDENDAGACSGHGVCKNGTCACHVRYEGDTCATLACLNACSSQGECFNGTCYCFENFAGEDCSGVACDGDCHGNGVCNNGTCSCNAGWAGLTCEQPACPNNCSNHGTCTVNATCDCNPYFSGDDCSNSTCPIVGGKVCNGVSRGFCRNDTCVCRDGYGGFDCSQTVCPNNCSGHGTCSNFTCSCRAGWRGIDCSVSACDPGCEDHGYCHGGKCFCDPGWTNHLVPVDDPDAEDAGGNSSMGSNSSSRAWGAAALPPPTSARLRMSNGCQKMVCPGDCSGHGQCSNFTCQCEAPWRGERCDILPCPHNCSGLGTCNNGTCVCDEGVWGSACERIECPVRSEVLWSAGVEAPGPTLGRGGRRGPDAPPRCSGHGACSPTGECVCEYGFTGDACERKACPNDCHNRGTCRADGTCDCGKHFGAADCSFAKCTAGLSDEVLTAEAAGLSPRLPTCGGHGQCVNGTCFCEAGYTGAQCTLTACKDMCNYHGRCGRDGRCLCDAGWKGDSCQHRYVVPHHGLLLAGDADPPECFQGWTGPDCGTAQCPRNCSNSPSTTGNSSHGECRDGKCHCAAGWTGESCAQRACPHQCRSHGTCGHDGRCRCDDGFTGDSCSVRYVEHGFCNAADGTCTCGPVHTLPNFPGQQWEGPACNRRSCPGNCSAHLGQGQCKGDRTSATCLCKVGFTGEDCSLSACPSGCSGHGVCEHNRSTGHGPGGSASCRCDTGFGGPNGDCAQRVCVGGCGAAAGRGQCDEALGLCTCKLVDGIAASEKSAFPGQKWAGIDCGSRSCLNDCSGDGGVCVNGTCFCRDGRGGEDCSVPVCPKACGFHGRCGPNGRCRCDDGWTGETCTQPQCPGTVVVNGFAARPRVEVPCSGHGECAGVAEDAPSFSCECEPGWTGFNCSRRQCVHNVERHLRAARLVADGLTRSVRQGALDGESDGESSSAGDSRGLWSSYRGRAGCGPNGFCVNGTCYCDQGWGGSDCDVRVCPNSCGGRGVCQRNGTCRCADGWGGRACEQRVCRGQGNCSGHGVCLDGYDDLHLLIRTPAAEGFPALNAVRRVADHANFPNATDGPVVSNATARGLASFGGTANSTQSHTAATVHRPGPTCSCAAGWGGPDCSLKLCPRNCSGHGACVDGACVCKPMRQGAACEVSVPPRMAEDMLLSLAFLSERWCPHNCSNHGRCAITGVFVDTDAAGDASDNSSAHTSFLHVGRLASPEQAAARGIEVIRQHPDTGAVGDGENRAPWFEKLGSFSPVSLLQTNEQERHASRLRHRHAHARATVGLSDGEAASVWDWLPPMDFMVNDGAVGRSSTAPVGAASKRHDSGKSQLHAMSLLGLAGAMRGKNDDADASALSLTRLMVEHTYRAQCVCDAGWLGFSCDQRYHSACERLNHCSGHGVCATNSGGITPMPGSTSSDTSPFAPRTEGSEIRCECSQGWTGHDCSTRVKKHCSHLNSCTGHGQCVEVPASQAGRAEGRSQYACACEDAWTGAMCSQPLPKPCPGGCVVGRGECVNGECLCRNGFTGPRCESSTCPNQCSGHGACDSSAGGPLCLCQPDFTGEDCSIQQCPHACSGHGSCSREGSPSAIVPFASEGISRLNAPSNGEPSPTVTLSESSGTRMVFDGTHSGISSSASQDPPGSAVAVAPMSAAAKAEATSELTPGGKPPEVPLTCGCFDGYFGAACQFRSCNASLCNGHGACSIRALPHLNANWSAARAASTRGLAQDNYTLVPTCACANGYSGPACEFKRCPAACRNGGHCSTDGVCVCASGFTGETCETKLCPAQCNGRGTCDAETGTCTCAPEFYGPSCELRKVPCRGWCSGHGTCNTAVGACACSANYTGEDCSLRRCPNDCSGNGVCDHRTGVCTCNFNAAGAACDKRTSLGDAQMALRCAQHCMQECNVGGNSSVGGSKGTKLPGLDVAPLRAYTGALETNSVVGCLQNCEKHCMGGSTSPTGDSSGVQRRFPTYPKDSAPTQQQRSLLVDESNSSHMLRRADYDAKSNRFTGPAVETVPFLRERQDIAESLNGSDAVLQQRPSSPQDKVNESAVLVSTQQVLHDPEVAQRAKDLLKSPLSDTKGATNLPSPLDTDAPSAPQARNGTSAAASLHVVA